MRGKEFREIYPEITDFLAPFVLQCYEDISDMEIIERSFGPDYFKSCGLKAIKEADNILSLNPFPEEAIETITNIWHDDLATRDWFISIIEILKKKCNQCDVTSSSNEAII